MNRKILFSISAFILIFLISLSGVSAYYPSYGFDGYGYPGPGVYPNYYYYDDTYDEDDYKYPIVMGPYPRQYLWHKDADDDFRFVHDDFDHYDSFIGYKDLDVYYPHLGIVDIIRNPDSTPLDLSQIPANMTTFGKHVHGYIPGGGEYVKHYNHEHEWEPEYGYDHGYYGYDNYGFDYFTLWMDSMNKPVYNRPCQSVSACQYGRCMGC